MGGQTFYTVQPTRVWRTIDHKPPGPGQYEVPPDEIPLVNQNGEPTDFFLVFGGQLPSVIEFDSFLDFDLGPIGIRQPDGTLELVSFAGPAEMEVYFEGAQHGDANDDDTNGLDEVETELVSLSLAGASSLGPIQIGVNPNFASLGQIE